MNNKFWEKMGVTPGPWVMADYTDEDVDFSVCADPKERNGRVYKADWIAEFYSDNTDGGVPVTIKNAQLITGCFAAYENQIKNLIALETIYDIGDNGMFGFVIASRIDNTKRGLASAFGSPWPEIRKAWEETVND